MRYKKLSLMISMALAPLAALPALAQAPAGSGLEEVTVTAQRREQNLQDVPISVTAFSGETLAKSNIKSAAEYLSQTPNVSYTEDGQTGSRGIGISVRGVGTMVTGENAFINTIGVYMDEFSVVSVPNQVANPQLPDMQRVEILRGPQGTYFGRNAVGGALNLTTNRPTDKVEGSVRAGYESYGSSQSMWNLTGVVNLPASDTFRMRGVAMYENSDGYVTNACAKGASAASCPGSAENGFTPNGAKDSGHETKFIRLSADWDVSDATTVKTTFFHTDEDQGTDENVPTGVLDLDSADTFGIGRAEDPGTGFWPNNDNELSHDINESTKNKSTIAILNIAHQFSDQLTLKSITGIIDASTDRLFDNDLIGGMDALKRTNEYDGKSWSTELRLEYLSDDYDLVVGAMYAKDEQEQDNNVAVSSQATATINGVGVLPPFPEGLGLALNHKEFEVESKAVFADATFHASDRLDVTVGARYTWDDVTNRYAGNGIRPNCNPGQADPNAPDFCTNGFFGSFINFARPPAKGDESFGDLTPRLVVRYEISDDTSIYGTISKGYKAGGSSVGNDAGGAAVAVKFNEEGLWNYEAGVKSEFLDNRVRLNASVFHLEWSDLQMESFRFLVPGDLSTNFEQTINIKDADATGIELELLAAVTEHFTISGALGYLDTEITSNTQAQITGGFVVDLKGLELPKAPELTGSLAGEYRWNVGLCDCEGWVRLEYIHRDGQYSDIEGLTNRQTRTAAPNSGIVRRMSRSEFPYLSPDIDIFNLRAGFDTDTWQASAYVENLGDSHYYTGTQENFGISGIRVRPHPRIIGANVTYKF